jgi:hypothetical protein
MEGFDISVTKLVYCASNSAPFKFHYTFFAAICIVFLFEDFFSLAETDHDPKPTRYSTTFFQSFAYIT